MIRLFILASLISGAVYAQESQDKKEAPKKCPDDKMLDYNNNCVNPPSFGPGFGVGAQMSGLYGYGFGYGYGYGIPGIAPNGSSTVDKPTDKNPYQPFSTLYGAGLGYGYPINGEAWEQFYKSMAANQTKLIQMQKEMEEQSKKVKKDISSTCAQNSDLTLVECSDGKVYKLDASYDQSLRKVVEKDQDASKKAPEKSDAASVKQE